MANLAAPFDRKIKYDPQDVIVAPMAAVKLFRGAAVVYSTAGYVNKPTVTTLEKPLGVALETKDNSAGNAGDKSISVVRRGLALFAQTGTAITQADVGALAYFTDDQTVTKVAGALKNRAGFIAVVDAEGVWIQLEELFTTI